MSKNDSYNFRRNALQKRVKQLVGGDDQKVELWWETPLPYAPFNLRAPQDLMNDDEWRSVRDWLTETIPGGYDDDVDYHLQNAQFLENPEEGVQPVSIVQADGGDISYFENYKIHTFTTSGQFYVWAEGTVEYLLVGGGGAGGGWMGAGGGGGGGVVTGKLRVTPGNYDVIIGAGGNAGSDIGNSRDSTAGGDTTALGKIAYGGGVGGCPFNVQISGMPSGWLEGKATGGGGYCTDANPVPGLNNQLGAPGWNGIGFKGGNGNVTIICGGGGGGAGGPGGDATVNPDGSTGRGGAGGIGVMSDISGLQTYYGGGGGGGAHGVACIGGVGGRGGGATAPLAGQPGINTGPSPAGTNGLGGGGAGASGLTGIYGVNGGAGGSGIAIIRYKVSQEGKGVTYGSNVAVYNPAN